jgi:hypothetical protein
MKECIVGISNTPFYDNHKTIKQNAAVNIKILMGLLSTQHPYFLAAAASQSLKIQVVKIFQIIHIIL